MAVNIEGDFNRDDDSDDRGDDHGKLQERPPCGGQGEGLLVDLVRVDSHWVVTVPGVDTTRTACVKATLDVIHGVVVVRFGDDSGEDGEGDACEVSVHVELRKSLCGRDNTNVAHVG